MRLATVVLTYNEQDNLPACLDSLCGLDCQLFVVDSGSTDRTVAIAQATAPQSCSTTSTTMRRSAIGRWRRFPINWSGC